jgi:hypothetical protein
VSLLFKLKDHQRRGSKPRCHWLTHGSRPDASRRLSALASPWAMVRSNDRWMPEGFEVLEEAQLHRAPGLLDPARGQELARWWLSAARPTSNMPNWDLASTCIIDGRAGLLLIEAKAHASELIDEDRGKPLDQNASSGSRANHERIGSAIEEASVGLSRDTGLSWALSRDRHYQMSNRFAWAWKLTEFGIPVVVIYLGFLAAEEMRDLGEPLADAAAWERLVRSDSGTIVPDDAWEHRWTVNGQAFIPLIRSLHQSLDRPEVGAS